MTDKIPRVSRDDMEHLWCLRQEYGFVNYSDSRIKGIIIVIKAW